MSIRWLYLCLVLGVLGAPPTSQALTIFHSPTDNPANRVTFSDPTDVILLEEGDSLTLNLWVDPTDEVGGLIFGFFDLFMSASGDMLFDFQCVALGCLVNPSNPVFDTNMVAFTGGDDEDGEDAPFKIAQFVIKPTGSAGDELTIDSGGFFRSDFTEGSFPNLPLVRVIGCGDAILQPELGEQCDDGNKTDDDGCSAECLREGGLSKDQQKCVNGLNADLAKLTKDFGGEICKCIKDGAKLKLPPGPEPIAECIAADRKGKLAKAQDKTLSDFEKLCTGITEKTGEPKLPFFGPTDPNAINQIGVEKELWLFDNLFGSDIDDTIITQEAGVPKEQKFQAICQQSIAKNMKKCQDTKLKEFNTCKKTGLKAKKGEPPAFEQPEQLWDTCRQHLLDDPKGKIAKACDQNEEFKPGKFRLDKIRKDIDKKCIGKGATNLAELFPGCGTDDPEELHDCIDTSVECHVCLAIAQADNLDTSVCDDFDNGVDDDSCAFCPHDFCTEGGPLDSGCGSCEADICTIDPFCCDTEWDSTCVEAVSLVCGLSDCQGP